jgi:hypothetical protein
MKYLAILGFILGAGGALYFLELNDKSKPEKKYTYSVLFNNVLVTCKEFRTNGGSEQGVILEDCSTNVLGEEVKIEKVLGAVNVVVEEIKK